MNVRIPRDVCIDKWTNLDQIGYEAINPRNSDFERFRTSRTTLRNQKTELFKTALPILF